MEKVVSFFGHIESWQRTAMLVGGLLLFWLIEGAIPLFHFRYPRLRHAGLNLFFTFTTLLINFIFAYLIVLGSGYTSEKKIGLLYVFHLPLWLSILLGMMILDLVSSWFIHWLQHKIKWMWKFHIVHHTDKFVDTTTANRHHPGESIFRAIFTFLAVILTGAPLWMVYLYQFFSVLLAQFNHANISLPKWMDNWLSWVIVSPDMHKVHHHYKQPLTDSNYGNIFSIWDRVFGTYANIEDTRNLYYGIDSYLEEADNNRVGRLLEIPFGEYRPPPGAKFSEPD
ncbi:MAG TPA: sterol desaturase family protein [Puia sp.]|nr:sterol desaturase family protein [Puia sp.]